MYDRILKNELLRLSKHFPIISVSGPRQSGKTTLCKMTFPDYGYANMEDEETRALAENDLKGFLNRYPQGLVIDEAHHLPRLFSALQVMVDDDDSKRFVLSGSSNFLMLRNISQSLAGRVAITRLLPLSLHELRPDEQSVDTDELIYKGLYPAIWGKDRPAFTVYDSYFSTYIQRDVHQMIQIKEMDLFRKFVRLCAVRIGNEFVASTLASEVGVSVKTIQNWFGILEASYITYFLQPYHKNIGKRLVKTPKMYFHDTGLVCYLLGYHSPKDVATSPLRGALFENLVINEMLKSRFNATLDNNLYYYRDKSQHEVDVIQEDASKIKAFEIKSATVFHTEFLKNLDYLKSLYGNSVISTQVIYDGLLEWPKTDNGLLNFRNL